MKDLMARFGKGAAKVDLVLDQSRFQLGDTVEGKLLIHGGEVEQKINKIDVKLEVIIRHGDTDHVHTITSIPFYESFTIRPGETREFPFAYQLPYDLLISGNYVTYYFHTDLDIAGGVDQKDRDYIEILCPAPLQKVLDALGQLGFREKHDSREFNGRVQEFELFPTGFLQGQAEELEFVAAVQPDGIRLLLELEFYSSFGGKQEVKREVFISNEELEPESELVGRLQQILSEMAEAQGGYHGSFSHEPVYHEHSHGHSHGSSGLAGAIGGFAAGMIGGMIMNEVIDELMDDDDDDDDDDDALEELEDFFEDED
nr:MULTISPECIES: sporulation protein [Thermoactinomyces]